MKKLGMTVLAVALALPFTLAAKQSQSTPAAPATTTAKTKTAKANKAKHTTKKHHHKKGTQTNATPSATK